MPLMSNEMHTPQDVAAQNLRRLFFMRNFMIAGQSLAVAASWLWLDLALPLTAITATIGFLALLNFGTWLRLQRPSGVSDRELLVQLLLDIAALTVLFYFTGGYSNPFVWMYLLPLTVAAVALPWAWTWLIAGIAVASYTLLMFYYQPLAQPHAHHHGGSEFSTHLLGMWLGFVISAGIIAYFVVRIQRNLREYDRMLADAREKVLESERMLSLGALATGAAHELGTPLATMAVLTREMSEEHAGDPALAQDFALLRQQVDRCKEILSSLAASAGQMRGEGSQGLALDDFLEQTLQRWRDTRPALQLDCTLHGTTPAPQIAADRTLSQALVNLLDNAADASPQHVDIRGGWDDGGLRLDIRDFGTGLSPEIAGRAGTPFFTTKNEDGMGLGLYLARMILGRFDGGVTLENHPQGGTVTRIRVPLAKLAVEGRP